VIADVFRVAVFVALLGAVLAGFAALGSVVLAQALSGTAVGSPLATLSWVGTIAAVGGAIGLGYGVVAGLVVAIARRIPIPGRSVVAALIVFLVGLSGVAERLLAVAFGDAALPRLDDPALKFLVRAVPSSIVALVTWQEVRARATRPVATVGQAGRARRR